jgi:hypothetical protein
MADRIPLVIVSTETGYELKELPNEDNVDLESNSIINAENITAFGIAEFGTLFVNGTEIEPGNISSTNSGNSPFSLANFTTEQRDALASPSSGDMIYNTTVNKFQGYANGEWADLH